MKKSIIKLKKTEDAIRNSFRYYRSRRLAKQMMRELVKQKKRKFIDKKILEEIKIYAEEHFGSASYTPWLELYTEAREEFIHGWIPEDYYRFDLLEKYNPESAAHISGYKSFDNFLFKGFSIPAILYSISGILYSGNRKKITLQEADKTLKDLSEEVIIKPELGQGGEGIKFSHSSSINLKRLLSEGDFIVQPVCKQHHELQRINPNSLNTLRVFTSLEKNGNAKVLFSYQKFGTGASRLDNGSTGGGICGIHDDGTLHEFYYDLSFMKRSNVHPNTAVKLSGIKIPNFDEIKKACKKAHESYPYVKFIGWDVAVGIDEEPILIEWNARYPMLAYGEALFGPLWNETPV